MFRKIITYFLILAVVLPVFASAVPLPLSFSVNIAYAEDVTKKTSSNVSISDPCATSAMEQVATIGAAIVPLAGLSGGSIWDCAAYTIVNLLYKFLMKIAIWLAGGLASTLFNISIQFSLTGEIFDADKNKMIKDGWTLVRDLLNLVFIFILLYAAISTILQYGSFDIKKVLPGLIVAALLVNFSLMISKMVIDASHIFAWEFYNQIDVTSGGTVAEIKDSANVKGDFKKKNLANVFMAGFNPQRLLVENQMSETTEKTPWKEVVEHATKKTDDGQPAESLMATLWRMALIILLESALALFAAFILFAGAIMFVARVVVLWLVMIFSPIAFLSMILPSMGKYSSMWWKYLIDQSFFAPAFLFMFMLSTKLINNKLVDNLLELTGNDNPKIAIGMSLGGTARIFFNFLIVGFIMSLSLVVARQLGGKVADFGISWAHKGKDFALGGAKKLAWSPTRFGLRYAGGAAGDSGWWAKSIGRIPGGNILGRKLGAMKKADEDKARKTAEKYAGTLSSAGRKSLASDIEGKGFVKRFMYTGPEGAFKPGKEGYEKIITKKNAEKEEEDRVFKKRMELMGGEKEFLDKFADIGSGDSEEVMRQKIDNAKQRAKSLIRQGDTAELDKLIEEKDKLEEEKNEIERDSIVAKKRKLNLEIDGYKYSLNEARKSGKGIDLAEKVLLGAQKDIEDYEKKTAEIVAREKHRENLQKTVDKYDDKQRAKAGKPEEKKEKEAKSK